MPAKWVAVAEGIVAPLNDRIDAFVQSAMDKSASDNLNEDDLDNIYESIKELGLFIAALREVGRSGDPASHLSPVYDEDGRAVPDYLELRVGNWVAYWYVNNDTRIYTGIYVRDTRDEPIDSLKNLLKSI
jgi:hypothetical protein